jgi:hypothetical protein
VPETKKNVLKPWQKKEWGIPPKQNEAFVAQMEQVLDVYQRPYDATQPVICMDESSKQVLSDVRFLLPLRLGHSRKEDYH